MLSGFNSKVITADGVVGPTSLVISAIEGIYAEGGSGAATTASIYDGTGTGGTKLAQISALTGDFTALEKPIAVSSGQVYVDISTTGGSVTVVWR